MGRLYNTMEGQEDLSMKVSYFFDISFDWIMLLPLIVLIEDDKEFWMSIGWLCISLHICFRRKSE